MVGSSSQVGLTENDDGKVEFGDDDPNQGRWVDQVSPYYNPSLAQIMSSPSPHPIANNQPEAVICAENYRRWNWEQVRLKYRAGCRMSSASMKPQLVSACNCDTL